MILGHFQLFTENTITVSLPFFDQEFLQILIGISIDATHKDPLVTLFQAIPPGFMIAALVWMLPSAVGAEFRVIITITFVIAIGYFALVIAGSIEVFLLLLTGDTQLLQGFGYLVSAATVNLNDIGLVHFASFSPPSPIANSSPSTAAEAPGIFSMCLPSMHFSVA